MILDALTRAEHERQIEKQPDLKFVTPVKPSRNKPNKVWLYVGLGVLANALILFLVIRAFSGSTENEIEVAAGSASVTTSSTTDTSQQIQPTVKSVQPESQPQAIAEVPKQAQSPNPNPNSKPKLKPNLWPKFRLKFRL